MGKGISEVDPVLEALGGRSRYQLMQYFLVMFSVLSTAFQLLNFVFVGRSIPHTCTAPDNLTDIFNVIDDGRFSLNTSSVEFDKCNIRVTNNISGTPETASLDCIYGYTFDEPPELSIITDLGIICDKASLKGLGQTLLILGQGLGASFFTVFSDRYGRRPVHLVAHTLMLGLGVGVAFAPSYLVFLILRVILGACQQGVVMTQTTYYVEMFPAKFRRISGLLTSLMWSAATMLISLIAYLARDLPWRTVQLIYCAGSLYVIVQYFTIDESIRWMMANDKDKEIIRTLKKAARISGKKQEEVLGVYNGLKEKYEGGETTKALLPEEDKSSKPPKKDSFIQLFKRKRLVMNVLVLWFTWLTDSMTFFGLFMTAHSLAGSRFLNFFLFALLESPAAFITYFMIDRKGRRKTSSLLHFIAGIALLLATVIKDVGGGAHWAETVVTACSCIGVFGISGAWGASFFFTPEMFPTNLRNFGLGTSSSFSRIGGMLAPFASLLAEYVSWAPGTIFSGCCIAVSLLVHLLPETMGRELPQTLHDLVMWYKTEPKETDGYENKKKKQTDAS